MMAQGASMEIKRRIMTGLFLWVSNKAQIEVAQVDKPIWVIINLVDN